ncbi:MAG TPA: hypothetical protein PLB18_19300 [Acidobacteriota bacterium]|nr:hypothetical protein [Acidobacteriota bacterium]
MSQRQLGYVESSTTSRLTMADAIMCLATVAFFAVAAVYVRGCKRL